MADLIRRLAVARGDEPADLVLTGGRVLSVFPREWLGTNTALLGDALCRQGRFAEALRAAEAAADTAPPGHLTSRTVAGRVRALFRAWNGLGPWPDAWPECRARRRCSPAPVETACI